MGIRNFDVSLLRTFVAAAENEHFGSAAEKIFKSQAAVSQQMKRLEDLLGCYLFIQVGRNKQLTDKGARMLKYAKRILSLNDETFRAMAQTVFKDPVRLGVCADGVDTLLPEYLARSAETYPDLRVDIHIGRSRWLASALRRGDIDLALDIVSHDRFQSIVLRESPMVWIAGASFHYQKKLPLPLVLIDSACVFRNEALAALNQTGRPWQETFQTTTLGGIRAALRAGLGITARSIEMLAPGLKVVDKELGLPTLPSICYRLYSREGESSEGVKRFCELVRLSEPQA